jgi:hypothetical protein
MLMSGYTKLFNSILASTIWRADDKVRIVWITLLAMAGRDGVAEGSVPGLADFARVSVKDCQRALVELSAPDPYSRSVDFDGRRIEAVDSGWRLLNHAKYRAKLGTDERREYLRVKQAEYRRKQKLTNVNDVSDKSTVLTQAEAEAEAKVRTRALAAPENSPVEKRKPEENFKLIAALVSKELIPSGVDQEDLIEETKRACAKRKIAYNSQVVRKAVDSALARAAAR